MPDPLPDARRICVLTGAGISTDSGRVPGPAVRELDGTAHEVECLAPLPTPDDDLADLVVRELISAALPRLLARSDGSSGRTPAG